MSLFDCLKDIITYKTKTLHHNPEFGSVWSSFMIIRYLSMDKRFYTVAEDANRLVSVLSPEQMYLYLSAAISKSGNSYITYIKKPTAKS
jgi:hypothetical protein